MLCRDDHKVLGIIPIHRTHESDSRLHHELEDRLNDAVVQGHRPSLETAALASLALAVGLDRHLFPRSDRRAVRQRMAEVAGECPECEWTADAVHRAVDATDAALGSLRPVSSHNPDSRVVRSGQVTTAAAAGTGRRQVTMPKVDGVIEP